MRPAGAQGLQGRQRQQDVADPVRQPDQDSRCGRPVVRAPHADILLFRWGFAPSPRRPFAGTPLPRATPAGGAPCAPCGVCMVCGADAFCQAGRRPEPPAFACGDPALELPRRLWRWAVRKRPGVSSVQCSPMRDDVVLALSGRRPDPRGARDSARRRLVRATRRALGRARTERIGEDHAVPARQPVPAPLPRHDRRARRAAGPHRRPRAAAATGRHERSAGRPAAARAAGRGRRRHRQARRAGAVVAHLLRCRPGPRARAARALRVPGPG